MHVMDAAFAQKRDVGYAAVAATSWIAWDALIHLDVEVEYIWQLPNAPWMKIAYAFIRYATILQAGALLTLDFDTVPFTSSTCRVWTAEEAVFMELLAFTVEAILVLRLYVLFNHNKVVLCIMGVLFAAEIAIMASAIVVIFPLGITDETCQVLWVPSYFMAYWVSSLGFETFLFVLTLVAFVKRVKEVYKTQSIVFMFFVDGTWAFALIFVCMLLNTLMYRMNTNPLAGMGYYWDLSVMSFAGAHLLLNLRQLGAPDVTATRTAVSSIQFELTDLSGASASRAHAAQTSNVNGV